MKTMSPKDFVFLNKIGSGSYSEVYKAKYKTAIDDYNNKRQHFFAIKICSKEHIIREQKEKYVNVEKLTLLKLASKMIHPGIVNLYYTFHDTYNLYFVLDYISCGELFTYLYNSINKSMVQDYRVIERFVAQLLDTLKYLEINSIVHRDLKPEKILLNKKGCLMITDFGVACDLSSLPKTPNSPVRASSFVGTADYVSPELLLTNSCSYKADVWAAGCIFYQLRQGHPPFRGQNELETFENIVSGKHKPMVNMEDNADYVDLVRSLLVVDEAARLGVDEAMAHPFCRNIDWEQKSVIWTGIWEGPYPLDVNGDYYIQRASTQNTAKSVNSSPTKYVNNTARTKGIGVPRKRKPITTQNIVEWRRQLGINDSVSSVSSAVPVLEKGFRGMQIKDQGENMNTSSRAAQMALKRQVMKGVPGTDIPQLLPAVKTARNVARQQPAQVNKQEQQTEDRTVLKREINVPYHKIPYLESPKSASIYLDYHTFASGITRDAHNCELFMNFMDVNAGKIMSLVDGDMAKENVLEVHSDGKIRIFTKGTRTGILVGDLTSEAMNVYEYTPERRKGELVGDKHTWCIIESNDRSIYLMPYLSKDWNKLFKQIKKRNKTERDSNQAMIRNAASMAYKK